MKKQLDKVKKSLPSDNKLRYLIVVVVSILLLAACGQSYEETKRITRQQRRDAARKDSAALKVAVMPTLDCLPAYVAEHYELFDTLHGGVRLKFYMAQMDCDTALERGRVEGAFTDLVRAKKMEKRGTALRYTSATNLHWQLIASRNARVRQLKQLEDKMVAMTRFSATDLLTDGVTDSVKLDKDHVYKVQINDVSIRLLMMLNNEMDVMWLAEPQATVARLLKNNVVYDTKKEDIRLGALVFRDKEMKRKARSEQLDMFLKAYNQACDSINKYGVRHYRTLILQRCKMKENMVDSVPDNIKFDHVQAPRQQDIARAEKWLGKK